MIKSPEDYLSSLSFDPPEPDAGEISLDAAERAFVEKYLGVDSLATLRVQNPEPVPLLQPLPPAPRTELPLPPPVPRLVIAPAAPAKVAEKEAIALGAAPEIIVAPAETKTAAIEEAASQAIEKTSADIAPAAKVIQAEAQISEKTSEALKIAERVETREIADTKQEIIAPPKAETATETAPAKTEAPAQIAAPAKVETEAVEKTIAPAKAETRAVEKTAAQAKIETKAPAAATSSLKTQAKAAEEIAAPAKAEAKAVEKTTAKVEAKAPGATNVAAKIEAKAVEKAAAPAVEAAPAVLRAETAPTLSLREKMRQATELQVVSFLVAGQIFLLPVAGIQEVLRHMELVKVPQAPQYVAGAINLRGTVMPLVHLSALLTNAKTWNYDKGSFIIITDSSSMQMGLIIDKVSSMHMIPQSKIIWNVESRLGDAGEFLCAIVDLDDKVCGMIAPDTITQKILSEFQSPSAPSGRGTPKAKTGSMR